MRAPILAVGLAAGPAAAEPALRIAVLRYGTVNWLTDTILARDLDAAAGYRLEAIELAGRPATTIAFQVDVIVADWVWALQQRGRGGDLPSCPIRGRSAR